MAGTNTDNPTPGSSDVDAIAAQIEPLLDDEGQYKGTSNREKVEGRERDTRGRFSAAPDADAVEETADSVEGTDQPEAEESTAEVETEVVESKGEDAETDEADTETLQTLTELAEALEIPVDELTAQISHTFRAANEEVTVTLAEAISGYQKDADYRQRTSKLAEDRRAMEIEQRNRAQQYEGHATALAQEYNLLEQVFTAQLQDPQLAELRTTDPGEYSARTTEINSTLGAIRQRRQQTAVAYQQSQTRMLQEVKQREGAALVQAVPDWGSAKDAIAREAMISLGYAHDEIDNVYDSRLIRGALELAEARAENAALKAGSAKAADTVKRIKKTIPKLVKPGKTTTGTKVRATSLERLKAKLKKSGDVGDAAKLVERMMK